MGFLLEDAFQCKCRSFGSRVFDVCSSMCKTERFCVKQDLRSSVGPPRKLYLNIADSPLPGNARFALCDRKGMSLSAVPGMFLQTMEPIKFSPGREPQKEHASSDSTMSGACTVVSIPDREPKLLGAGMRVLVQTNKRNQSGLVSSFIGKQLPYVFIENRCFKQSALVFCNIPLLRGFKY